MITIFTPSYNRKNELKDLYKSLRNQSNNNFEWLIVDDGSKDNTEEYINKLIKECKVNIRYIYKENGGKQSAYNLGVKEAKGDIFLCIDSDDILDKNAVENIIKDFKTIKEDKNICGIMYNQNDKNNREKIIGTAFPVDNMIESYYDVYNKFGVKGDKMIVLFTAVAKKYLFPIIKEEKFVPEALIYNRISEKYSFVCRNKVVAYKEYLSSGYSANYFNLVKRNPMGNTLYFKELYKYNKNLYTVYGYILFSIYSKLSFLEIYRSHQAKIKVLLLYLPTLIISKIR